VAALALVGVGLAVAACNAPSSLAPRSPSPTGAPTSPTPTRSPTTSTTLAAAPVQALRPPPGPSSAVALFAELVPTELAIHDSATPLASLPVLGEVEQRDIGTLTAHPSWMADMPGDASPDVRATIRANVMADTELGAVGGSVPISIPPWNILTPRPADELLNDYHAAAAATGVPWTVLAAIHLVESRMGRIRGLSGAGAQGPMQFLPSTWAAYGAGGDILSDHDAIAAAARLLRANGAPTDVPGAVFLYNRSLHYVRAVVDYAFVMGANDRAFRAYYGWQVYVGTTGGDFLLPAGYRGG
jgi:Transglycosylase SLT domain